MVGVFLSETGRGGGGAASSKPTSLSVEAATKAREGTDAAAARAERPGPRDKPWVTGGTSRGKPWSQSKSSDGAT